MIEIVNKIILRGNTRRAGRAAVNRVPTGVDSLRPPTADWQAQRVNPVEGVDAS